MFFDENNVSIPYYNIKQNEQKTTWFHNCGLLYVNAC